MHEFGNYGHILNEVTRVGDFEFLPVVRGNGEMYAELELTVLRPVEAVEFENQRNQSSGIPGRAEAARHLAKATREFEIAPAGRSDQFQDFTD